MKEEEEGGGFYHRSFAAQACIQKETLKRRTFGSVLPSFFGLVTPRRKGGRMRDGYGSGEKDTILHAQ